MSKTQEALLTGNTSAGISGTESTRKLQAQVMMMKM